MRGAARGANRVDQGCGALDLDQGRETLDYAQQGVGSVHLPSREIAAENEDDFMLNAEEADDAQERRRAMSACGGREKKTRLGPWCESDGDKGSTSGARVRLAGDEERAVLDVENEEGFSDCYSRRGDHYGDWNLSA
jgi:hypothetical protein